MFLKKRHHAQVMAKVHGQDIPAEKCESDSGYLSDRDSEGERGLMIAEFDVEETSPLTSTDIKIDEERFRFSFGSKLVMEEVPLGDINVQPLSPQPCFNQVQSGENNFLKVQRESVIKHTWNNMQQDQKTVQYEKSSVDKPKLMMDNISNEDNMNQCGSNYENLICAENDILDFGKSISFDDDSSWHSTYDFETMDPIDSKGFSLIKQDSYSPCTFSMNDGTMNNQQQSLYLSSPGTNQIIIHIVSQDKSSQSNRKKDLRKKEFSCTYEGCCKSYFKLSHLNAHIRLHSGEKPFNCPYPKCDKVFARSDEFSRHKRYHSGIKKFVCTHCEKAFMRSDHLSKHEKRHEANESKISCTTKRNFKISPVIGSSALLVNFL
eukprot:GFUD01014497.1.p1 GENE.GFUD01014497.1~~GFUD01014497.1.p1  ORF type:complete len:377 (+),score=65.95 GFUD01014497.1:278-1408(+)